MLNLSPRLLRYHSMRFNVAPQSPRGNRRIALLLVVLLLSSPVLAQQPGAGRPAPKLDDPTLETLLATDAYKLYGEVRNVGQLLSTGGAGEIVEPVLKLADPGPEFKSLVAFLKKNSEALASARLMFATWPARTDVPNLFVAIEFPTNEDAAKFAPSLEKFLPTVLPAVSPEPAPANAKTQNTAPASGAKPTPAPSATPPTEQPPPFVITRKGNLVCVTDKSFKFEKLHPVGAKALFQDQNFRVVRDKYSAEPVYVFINVALEPKVQPSPTPVIITEEQVAMPAKDEPATTPTPTPDEEKAQELSTATLTAPPVQEPSPTPTPTKEQQAQEVASHQVGRMLDSLGFGEPQWPEAVGLALSLDGNEYVLKGMLIDKPGAKLLPIPFVPELIGGPAYNAEASTVLPDDTEMFLSVSINLPQTYEGMRSAAETKAKNQGKDDTAGSDAGVAQPDSDKQPELDAFAQFEKLAGFKIKDDLLPALGSEIAIAGSIKSLESAGGLNMGAPPAPKPSPDPNDPKPKNESTLPIVLVGVKDREAVKRLMPKVMVGLGFGQANLLAQTEKHGDAEIVNYVNILAYGFVGDFLVISDTAGVRRVMDANDKHETLSSNSVYRNSRRWQPGRTLGQLYVSPALMEGYHEQVRREAASLEPAMRDFLLSLNPKSEAITYALSNDGLATNHELHLPKNLILTMIAGISNAYKNPPPETNEMVAINALQILVSVENQYKAGSKNGPYASMQELIDGKMFPSEEFDKYGYKYELTVIGDSFEAVATPKEYGKTGKRSFFVDKSGVVRGGDHGGGPATVADNPVQE